MVAVTVDGKYRVTIPKEARDAIRPGDVLFFEQSEDSGVGVLHFAKAQNPFDILAAHALSEYRAGRTYTLDEVFSGDDDEPADRG